MARPSAVARESARDAGPPLLELDHVLRAFGRRAALRDVSLGFPQGSTTALLGPNGAGKTTLLRVLAGLARPTRGRLLFEGSDERAAERIRPRVGYVTHQTLLYDALTPRENLEFFARLYGVAAPRERAAAMLARFGLEVHADRTVATLSRGLQQRLALARALLHEADVLLLDEPGTGLDAAGVSLLAGTLDEQRDAGATVVLATHAFDETLTTVDHIAILDAGEIRHAGPRGALTTPEVARLYAETVRGAA